MKREWKRLFSPLFISLFSVSSSSASTAKPKIPPATHLKSKSDRRRENRDGQENRQTQTHRHRLRETRDGDRQIDLLASYLLPFCSFRAAIAASSQSTSPSLASSAVTPLSSSTATLHTMPLMDKDGVRRWNDEFQNILKMVREIRAVPFSFSLSVLSV
jgi:hypothetical protein